MSTRPNQRLKTWASTLSLLLLPAVALAGPVKIGVINAMTGPESPIGEQVTNGVKLAEEDLKARGIDVQLVWEDDTGKPAISMTALEKLASRDHVAGIVGPYSSSAAFADSRLAERQRVPLLVPLAAKEEITRQGMKWTFRIAATTVDRAAVLIDMALAMGHPKTVAILNENTDFGSSVGQSAKLAAEKRGLKVVFEEAYSKGSPDYRSTLMKMKAVQPDLVVMASYIVDAILLMRQAREMGLTPMAFLGAGAGFALAQFAKETDISEAVLSSTEWAPDVAWPGSASFARRYETRFGRPPTYHASGAYASMMIMGEVATKAGGDRGKIRELLHSGKWTTIVGDVAFADYDGYTNQNKRQMLVQQVLKGKHETVWPPTISSKKAIWPFPGWK